MHDGGRLPSLSDGCLPLFSCTHASWPPSTYAKDSLMLKLLLHTFSMAFPIVVVVLGILLLVGQSVFLPYFIGSLVIMLVLLVLLYLDKKKSAPASK